MIKTNGERLVQVDHSSVKQIAGRAGRRNSAYPNGEVTCRDPNDMTWLKEAMATDITPLKQAGLIPTKSHIESFTKHMELYGASEKDLQLHRILRKFSDMSQLQGSYFICKKQGMELISMWLKDIDNLSPGDKFSLCMSPVTETCPKSKAVFMRYIETYSNNRVPGKFICDLITSFGLPLPIFDCHCEPHELTEVMLPFFIFINRMTRISQGCIES